MVEEVQGSRFKVQGSRLKKIRYNNMFFNIAL